MDDLFTNEQGESFLAIVFEWSGVSSAVKPMALRPKTVMLVPKQMKASLPPLSKVKRESSGEIFLVKEIEDSGVGLLELRLEAITENDEKGLSHGEF